MSDLVVARNYCMTRMLPGEAGLVSELTGLPGRAKSVKRFERSNGLDTALYKNYIYIHEIKDDHNLSQSVKHAAKIKFRQYPVMHTNRMLQHCTILQYNHNI